MSEQDFYIEWAKVSEDKLTMEVSFRSLKNNITHMTCLCSADAWLKGTWAVHKLAEFEGALEKAVDILEGRR